MAAITVVARSKAKPGREGEFEAALRAVMAPTHREQGCLKYTVHRGAEDPSLFVVLERWASKADLDRHLTAPHIQELFRKAPDLAAAPAEITVYEQLEEGDPAKGRLS
jgi:quinol monooxygenase YgiN